MPSDAKRELLRIRFELDAQDDERLFGVRKRGVCRTVDKLERGIVEENGNLDW